MGNMRFKEGDQVRIKSLDWYNKNIKNNGIIICGSESFTHPMSHFCDKVVTIVTIQDDCYRILEDDGDWYWTDEMIEGLVKEENKPKFKVGDEVRIKGTDIGGTIESVIRGQLIVNSKGSKIPAWPEDVVLMKSVEEETAINKWTGLKVELELSKSVIGVSNVESLRGERFMSGFVKAIIPPEGYQFKDENGNVINTTKIVLEKKKKEYPKTYEECCEIVKVEKKHTLEGEIIRKNNYKINLLESFQKLLICRDAYWKLYGEEMGLNRPWEPDYDSGVNKYGIICLNGVVQESNPTTNWERHLNKVLDFPTAEMRDAFKENFKELIKMCKELL